MMRNTYLGRAIFLLISVLTIFITSTVIMVVGSAVAPLGGQEFMIIFLMVLILYSLLSWRWLRKKDQN